MEDIKTAIQFLEKEPLLHMGMTEVLRRGTADILHAGNEGVFLRDTVSGAYMLSCGSKMTQTGRNTAEEWIREQKNCELMVFYDRNLAEYAGRLFRLHAMLDCAQVVYTGKEPLPCSGTLKVKEPSENEMKIICRIYKKLSYEELYQIRELHHLYVGLINGKMTGFIGSHLEGGIGLLEILPEYRNQGFGTQLEIFMINHMLKEGRVPYGQVEDGNKKSEALQQKLGLKMAEGRVYWIF